MKRKIALLLALILIISLVGGCTQSGTTQADGSNQTTQSTAPSTTQPTTQSTTQPTTQPDASTAPTETTAPAETTAPTEPPESTDSTVPVEPDPTEPEPFDEVSFFSESVFIGDSVTQGLATYCMQHADALYDAKIFGVPLYSVYSAISAIGTENTISIRYQGQQIRPEDLLAAIQPERLFIMLGLNEVGVDGGVNWTIKNWGKLINNIREKCPDLEIYIQSVTPIWIGGERYGLTNERLDEYNQRLEEFCQEYGCYFVNVAPMLKDENGGLKTEYCSDQYIHLTNAGIEIWIDFLKSYAAEHYQN